MLHPKPTKSSLIRGRMFPRFTFLPNHARVFRERTQEEKGEEKFKIRQVLAILVVDFPKDSILQACLCSGPLGDIALIHEIVRRSADCSVHRLFDPLPSGLCVLEQRAECFPSVIRQE
uniref:Uncharacterized protein n=1 Tax=Solanum tuberosum TaxID=4113 RepID=M1D914_SOLTU